MVKEGEADEHTESDTDTVGDIDALVLSSREVDVDAETNELTLPDPHCVAGGVLDDRGLVLVSVLRELVGDVLEHSLTDIDTQADKVSRAEEDDDGELLGLPSVLSDVVIEAQALALRDTLHEVDGVAESELRDRALPVKGLEADALTLSLRLSVAEKRGDGVAETLRDGDAVTLSATLGVADTVEHGLVRNDSVTHAVELAQVLGVSDAANDALAMSLEVGLPDVNPDRVVETLGVKAAVCESLGQPESVAELDGESLGLGEDNGERDAPKDADALSLRDMPGVFELRGDAELDGDCAADEALPAGELLTQGDKAAVREADAEADSDLVVHRVGDDDVDAELDRKDVSLCVCDALGLPLLKGDPLEHAVDRSELDPELLDETDGECERETKLEAESLLQCDARAVVETEKVIECEAVAKVETLADEHCDALKDDKPLVVADGSTEDDSVTLTYDVGDNDNAAEPDGAHDVLGKIDALEPPLIVSELLAHRENAAVLDAEELGDSEAENEGSTLTDTDPLVHCVVLNDAKGDGVCKLEEESVAQPLSTGLSDTNTLKDTDTDADIDARNVSELENDSEPVTLEVGEYEAVAEGEDVCCDEANAVRDADSETTGETDADPDPTRLSDASCVVGSGLELTEEQSDAHAEAVSLGKPLVETLGETVANKVVGRAVVLSDTLMDAHEVSDELAVAQTDKYALKVRDALSEYAPDVLAQPLAEGVIDELMDSAVEGDGCGVPLKLLPELSDADVDDVPDAERDAAADAETTPDVVGLLLAVEVTEPELHALAHALEDGVTEPRRDGVAEGSGDADATALSLGDGLAEGEGGSWAERPTTGHLAAGSHACGGAVPPVQ